MLSVRSKIKIVRNLTLGLPLYEYRCKHLLAANKSVILFFAWDLNKNAKAVLSLEAVWIESDLKLTELSKVIKIKYLKTFCYQNHAALAWVVTKTFHARS